MNRFTRFGLATMLAAFAFTACDEGTPVPVEPPEPPAAVGTISGSVTIEGSAAAGITATLSSGATTTTGSGGTFAFAGVEEGTYTVTISGFPEDATFATVTQSATIATDGQNVQLNFAGEYIRSSAVVGSVVAADAMMSGGDGQPETLSGVTVTLDGEHAMGETMETGMDGGFAFTGLRAGTYTVTISDFPEDVSFETVSIEVEVEVGEVGSADFTGHYIRTSAVEGQVIIEGVGLAGVTVTLSGGPSDESHTSMTDAEGMYRFEDLRPGDYTVSISDFDTRDYEFAATSQDVSVDLDETGTVSFTGVLLRTSGIAGRVSVEGMGLNNIAVTLSGAADASTMTDAGGQYAFAGLAAGDYTVSIAVESAAFVFDAMSQSRTVADDESAIVNFEGMHARTASVSGQLFIDELDKNDALDAGENPLPAAGVPVALVGPGVNEQMLTATNAAGQFSFSGRRAGAYQLVVAIDAGAAATLAANDVAYGGPGNGYSFELDVGENKVQAIPFDITHTTVHFQTFLKMGDKLGDALPGAVVTLFADAAGRVKVGEGTTALDESDGTTVASIRVARAGTTANTVHAGVSAEGYSVADGMTAVSWDPQSFATGGSNSNDIVNLNVDVTISGETVTTDYGGGEALEGWEISVSGPASGGAPTMLGDDGSVGFTTKVATVPATFMFAAKDDQDDDLDGGESYESTGGSHTHDGLSLMGNVDADPITVRFTTQTLKVYVHQEMDHVQGYTGNVLGGDKRMGDLVDLVIRQASGSDGRQTSVIPSDAWDSRANSSGSRGAYTFSHLPTDLDIVVRADAMEGYKLLDHQQLDAYRNMYENGVMGSAFGAMGGFGHTVTLCPLHEVEPTGQDHGDCGSFAVVTTHGVTANVSKNGVRRSGTGFTTTHASDQRKSGIEVSLTPIDGKNLDGDGRSFVTASSNDPTTDIDERTDHDFGDMTHGAYELGLPAGWRGMVTDGDGEPTTLSPLGDAGHGTDVKIAVRPTTATVYGYIRNTDGFGLEGLSVDANGVEGTTDELGRYIISGVGNAGGKVKVTVTREGYPSSSETIDFAANTVTRRDVSISGAANTVAITGTVSESGTGTPLKGVTIKVDGSAPLNATDGKVVTGDDGMYTAIVEVQPNNDPLVTVTPSKSGYHFIPASAPVAALAGANPTADFSGYKAVEIVGRVTAPGGGMPRAEVTVRAYDAAEGGKKLDDVTTSETGTFSLFVPYLSGTVYLTAEPQDDFTPADPNYVNLNNAKMYHWFDAPDNRQNGAIAVIPGQVLNFGTFTGYSVQPRITSVRRLTLTTDTEPATQVIEPTGRNFNLVKGEPTNVIEIKWEYDTRNETGAHSAAGTDVTITPAGVGGTPETLPAEADRTERAGVADANSATHKRTTTVTGGDTDLANYGKRSVTVALSVVGADATATAAPATSAPVELAAVDGSISGLTADRDVTNAAGERATHMLTASWSGPGSPGLQHRVALYVTVEASSSGTTVSGKEWVVFEGRTGTASHGAIERATDIPDDTGDGWGDWSMGSFDLNLQDAAAGDWQDDDDENLIYAVTVENLRAASHLRIDTRVDGGDWVKHTPVDIPEG